MPYINKDSREWYASILGEVRKTTPQNCGELNYLLSSIAKIYWEKSYESYQSINDVIGALEGAKLEFYRRIASDFEDVKLKTNGDI